MSEILEKDWKKIRAIKDEKLNAVCADILGEINQEIKNKEENNHKAYLNIWDIVNTRDKDIVDMFNDLRRSNAVYKLALWYKKGYVTEKELNEFSKETRSKINALCN
jgi:hypothetical protein